MLIDQVPVSTDKDVEVKLQELSGARMAETRFVVLEFITSNRAESSEQDNFTIP